MTTDNVIDTSIPSHYLSQCYVIVNWTLRNKHQRNFDQNTKFDIHQTATKFIVCEMSVILSRGGGGGGGG